jgi:hypothetical protein
MGWYNNGNWSDLASNHIAYIMSDICTGVNQRLVFQNLPPKEFNVSSGSNKYPLPNAFNEITSVELRQNYYHVMKGIKDLLDTPYDGTNSQSRVSWYDKDSTGLDVWDSTNILDELEYLTNINPDVTGMICIPEYITDQKWYLDIKTILNKLKYPLVKVGGIGSEGAAYFHERITDTTTNYQQAWNIAWDTAIYNAENDISGYKDAALNYIEVDANGVYGDTVGRANIRKYLKHNAWYTSRFPKPDEDMIEAIPWVENQHVRLHKSIMYFSHYQYGLQNSISARVNPGINYQLIVSNDTTATQYYTLETSVYPTQGELAGYLDSTNMTDFEWEMNSLSSGMFDDTSFNEPLGLAKINLPPQLFCYLDIQHMLYDQEQAGGT